jgi:hypothetical protein
MTVPVFLKAVDVFSPMAFTFSFSLGEGGREGAVPQIIFAWEVHFPCEYPIT